MLHLYSFCPLVVKLSSAADGAEPDTKLRERLRETRDRDVMRQDQIRNPGIALRFSLQAPLVHERIARRIYSLLSPSSISVPKGLKLYVFHGKAVFFQSRTCFRRSPEFLLLQLLRRDCESHCLQHQSEDPYVRRFTQALKDELISKSFSGRDGRG